MVRSRIATAAVVASLVAGLAACGSSKGGSGGTGGTTPAPTASTTVADGGASPTASASVTAGAGTSDSTAAGGFSNAQLEVMRAKVAAVFGQGVTPATVFGSSQIDTKELAADFESTAVMNAVWGTGAAGSDRPMACGMAKYNGVAIGAVTSTGDSATVPVVLYEGPKAGTTAITVNVNPTTGVIKGVACGGAAAVPAAFPGIAPIAAYYGALVNVDQSVVNDKSKPYFTPAFAAWTPADTDYDKYSCGQNGPARWVVALTTATSGTSAWDYGTAPVLTTADAKARALPVGFVSSLAVDLGTNKISRVTCIWANPPEADNAHPAQYAQNLLDYYRLAADQKSLGADAEAAIRPLFTSDAAFTTAWSSTGAVPLLCTKTAKVPGSVGLLDGSTPTTSGTRLTVKLVTWPQWHPDAAGQETSKFAVVLDTTTMKISSINCDK
jgi:hypothetical protein